MKHSKEEKKYKYQPMKVGSVTFVEVLKVYWMHELCYINLRIFFSSSMYHLLLIVTLEFFFFPSST